MTSPADPNDTAAIEREIQHRQASLASTVDELADRVAPKNLAKRGAVTAQEKAKEAQEKAKEAVLDEDGALRVERIAAAGGAAVALLGGVIWRKYSGRSKKSGRGKK